MTLLDPSALYQAAESLLRRGENSSTEEALEMLRALTEREPQNAKAWFERAGAYDFWGREAEALPHYLRAQEIGFDQLPTEDQPRLFVQLGSTLRNLKKYEQSAHVLKDGIEKFPNCAALKAFSGLTAYSNGGYRKAAKLFLEASLPREGDSSMRDYARALGFYQSQIDTFPARQRNWMRIYLHEAEDPGTSATLATLEQAPALAHLMDVAYQGTIDHEGESPDQCLAEMKGTLTGKYGPYLDTASFVTMEGEKALAASLITLWKGKPLVAFTMTDPAHQGKGLSRGLLRKSMHALRQAGHKALYLVVTEGNVPAERLYRKLGFEFLGPAIPGRGAED